MHIYIITTDLPAKHNTKFSAYHTGTLQDDISSSMTVTTAQQASNSLHLDPSFT